MLRVMISAAALIALAIDSSALADGYDPSVEASSEQPKIAALSQEQAANEQALNLERAQGEDLATAIGHYARARSLLIAAIREFDKGYNTARPDAILDSAAWRAELIERAEDLDRVLAPQARVSKSGVRYEPNSALLSTEAKTK